MYFQIEAHLSQTGHIQVLPQMLKQHLLPDPAKSGLRFVILWKDILRHVQGTFDNRNGLSPFPVLLKPKLISICLDQSWNIGAFVVSASHYRQVLWYKVILWW